MEEIWKDIPDYEGYYQVSNLGRVKGLERKKITGVSVWKKTTGDETKYTFTNVPSIILKPSSGGKSRKKDGGYLRVSLTKENIKKTAVIHTLVAKLFIDNPLNKKCVNHIDMNKQNNTVTNLEWCTYSENMIHYYSKIKQKS